MNKDELIVKLVFENITLREENEKLKKNSIPVTKIYAGDLSALLKNALEDNLK